jgi:hypothetical protein
MSKEIETPDDRARLVARALLSRDSAAYHDDITTPPTEEELFQALRVVLPYAGAIRVPESDDGELGGVMAMVEPVHRIGLTLYPTAMTDSGVVGMVLSLYTPANMGLSTEQVIHLLRGTLDRMAEKSEQPEQPTTH